MFVLLDVSKLTKKVKLYCCFILLFCSLMHIFASLESRLENKRVWNVRDEFLANVYGILSVCCCLLASFFLYKIWQIGVEAVEDVS